MEKKFITKEQQEKVSNRLVLNFGILLAGALIMLYVYNFAAAGYSNQLENVLGVLGIVFAVAGIAFLVLGYTKLPKLKNYSAIFFGAFIPCALVSYFQKIPFLYNRFPDFSAKNAVVVTLVLMALYFIVFSVYTAIYSATHTVLVEKRIIHHKKKR